MSKYIKILFKIAFSVAFFWVLFSFVKGSELVEVIQQVDPTYMVIGFVITCIMVVVRCMKWKVVLDLKDKKVPFTELLKIYMIGNFFSNILPSTVGGDVVRSYYAGRCIDNQAYSAVSVFVERFSGILFLFILVIIAPVLQPQLYKSPYMFMPACVGMFFLIAVLWVWMAKTPFAVPNMIGGVFFSGLAAIAQKSGIRLFVKLAEKGEAFYHRFLVKLQKFRTELRVATEAVKGDKTFLWRIIYLTILFYVLTWVHVYTAYRVFGVNVDFVVVCAVVPAIMLVAHFPVTLLGNLGYFESVFVFYFLLVGVGGAETLAMGLFLRLMTLLMGVMGFGVYLVYKQRNELNVQQVDAKENIV